MACTSVGCVVGAEALGEAAGLWAKVRFYKDGPFLCATVYSVAAGDPRVVEVRVDTRPIMRALLRAHAELHGKDVAKASLRGQAAPAVGFNLLGPIKKAAKAIGRTKLVKGVAKVTKAVAGGVKAVAKSKAFGAVLGVAAVFPLTAAIAAPALGAYAAANAAVSGVELAKHAKNVAKGAAVTISAGVKIAAHVGKERKKTAAAVAKASKAMPPAKRKAALVSAKAAAGASLTLKAQVKANLALSVHLPKVTAKAVVATTALQVKATPLMAKAAATVKTLRQPAVRARLASIVAKGNASQATLLKVQASAQAGNLDAQKSAAVVNLVARNRARLQGVTQLNTGGLPGLLITPDGRLVRGRFRVQAKGQASGLLYQGPGQAVSRAAYAKVSGECYAINGDLPLDGVRLSGKGANAFGIGPYDSVSGCGGDCGCASCV